MDETLTGKLKSAALGIGLTAVVFGTAFAAAFW